MMMLLMQKKKLIKSSSQVKGANQKPLGRWMIWNKLMRSQRFETAMRIAHSRTTYRGKNIILFSQSFFWVKFIIFQDSISMKYDDKKRDDSDVHNFEKTITLRGRFKKTNNFEVANCKHVEPVVFF